MGAILYLSLLVSLIARLRTSYVVLGHLDGLLFVKAGVPLVSLTIALLSEALPTLAALEWSALHVSSEVVNHGADLREGRVAVVAV